MVRLVVPLIAALMLAGCQTAETAPPPVITEQNFCSEASRALGSPYTSEWQAKALHEKMRNRGCLS